MPDRPPALPSPSAAPAKRRLLQLHLSTCVILMFLAGVLMYLNFKSAAVAKVEDLGYGNQTVTTYGPAGWPFAIGFRTHYHATEEQALENAHAKYTWDYIAGNLAAAVALLAAAAAGMEWFIRKREAGYDFSLRPLTWAVCLAVLSLLAGLNAIGANLDALKSGDIRGCLRLHEERAGFKTTKDTVYGCPFHFYVDEESVSPEGSRTTARMPFDLRSLLEDIAVALFLLAAVTVLAEFAQRILRPRHAQVLSPSSTQAPAGHGRK